MNLQLQPLLLLGSCTTFVTYCVCVNIEYTNEVPVLQECIRAWQRAGASVGKTSTRQWTTSVRS